MKKISKRRLIALLVMLTGLAILAFDAQQIDSAAKRISPDTGHMIAEAAAIVILVGGLIFVDWVRFFKRLSHYSRWIGSLIFVAGLGVLVASPYYLPGDHVWSNRDVQEVFGGSVVLVIFGALLLLRTPRSD